MEVRVNFDSMAVQLDATHAVLPAFFWYPVLQVNGHTWVPDTKTLLEMVKNAVHTPFDGGLLGDAHGVHVSPTIFAASSPHPALYWPGSQSLQYCAVHESEFITRPEELKKYGVACPVA